MYLCNQVFCTFCTLLYIMLFLNNSFALRDVRVQIPHAVKKGEKAILNCLYDLEGDSLYSVKWYKGRREFYSFTPKENPAMKVFQFAGVKVDRSSSNESQLVLETVNVATSGKYSCEVSADAPSFHTLIGAGELEVVVPGKDPIISGIRSRYKVGDIVRGNCTSLHSRPAANITWTVNGYETNPAHIRHFKPHKDPRELETVISAIHFVVTPQHFIYGKLKIRCTAFIHDVYWKSTEKSVEENRLSKSATSNVVHKFSEDYFDLDEDNAIDRSDTYMTHIKGDVSSLNANGGSALHKCSCFWPRLATLSLILFAMQQLFQLLQQLLRQTTTKIGTEKSKQSVGNCQTLTTSATADKENVANIFKMKITRRTTMAPIKENLTELNTITSLAVQVSTICYENKSTEEYWPKEKYFQIKLIKKKHQLQQQQQKKQHLQRHQLHPQKATQWQFKNTNNISTHKLNYYNEQQQQSQLLQEYDKTLFKYKYECDLTTTSTTTKTQLANIFLANIVTLAFVLQYSRVCYKVCNKHYKLYAQFCMAFPNSCCFNDLNANTGDCLNTLTTGTVTFKKGFLLIATLPTAATIKIST